jgi:NAD(P)-dependent dehydrogenase (short-subunit alcohol dehydrogenase family)
VIVAEARHVKEVLGGILVMARKILVNAISPGPIETPAMDSLGGTPEKTREFKAGMAASVPLSRLGQPDEIAKAAVFLASDDAS